MGRCCPVRSGPGRYSTSQDVGGDAAESQGDARRTVHAQTRVVSPLLLLRSRRGADSLGALRCGRSTMYICTVPYRRGVLHCTVRVLEIDERPDSRAGRRWEMSAGVGTPGRDPQAAVDFAFVLDVLYDIVFEPRRRAFHARLLACRAVGL